MRLNAGRVRKLSRASSLPLGTLLLLPPQIVESDLNVEHELEHMSVDEPSTTEPDQAPSGSRRWDDGISQIHEHITRVKSDIFHLLQRYGRSISTRHPLRGAFMHCLRDAFFINSHSDYDAVKQHLIRRGMSELDVEQLGRRFFVSRIRRFVPRPSVLAHRVQSVYRVFEGKEAAGHGPLFKEATAVEHAKVMDIILGGYASDWCSEMYNECSVDQYGLSQHTSVRGSSALEGFHFHLRQCIPGYNTSPRLASAHMQEFVYRHNVNAGVGHLNEIDYGFYRHEWIEELQELSMGDHAHLFRNLYFPLWRASPGDTGERFGVRGKRENSDASSACSSWHTSHFPMISVGATGEVGPEGQELAEEVVAVVEKVIGQELTEHECEILGEAGASVGSVDQVVAAAALVCPATRTRAEAESQRESLVVAAQRAVSDGSNGISTGKVQHIMEKRRCERASRMCKRTATRNPYQRSAAKWLADAMCLPACVAPVSTDAEYELFMDMYMKLSENGKRGVNYQQMCSEWNERVVTEMGLISGASADVAVDQLFDRLRLKTSCQLSSYAQVLTDRYYGVNALQPYLDEYKKLRHELKKADADNSLAPTATLRSAAEAQPSVRLLPTKATMPTPSCFGGSQVAKVVRVRSVVLEPKAVNQPLGESEFKVEFCAQCWVHHQKLEVVYVKHPDGSVEEFHGGRQFGSKSKCPRVVQGLTTKQKQEWKLKMQEMRRKRKVHEIYHNKHAK